MTAVDPAERPFVGREAERAALAAHLAAARDGGGRVVLVSGDPGIGKTRLIEEAVAEVAPQRVFWGLCHETEGAPAYWPWIQVLRSYVRSTPPDQLRNELGDAAAELAQLVPAIRSRIPDLAPRAEDTAEADSAEPEAARFRRFDAVSMFLRGAASGQLLVVVLDDLHWADSESLRLLAFVARDLRDLPLLLLGSYRSVELRQTAAASRILADLARTSHSLQIAGLSVDDVARYVAAASGRAAPGETIAEIHRTSEGNAFAVCEIVQLLRSEGRLDAPGGAARIDIPDSVREVIRRRIEPLSDVGRQVLAAAAILGREFDLGILARVLELPVDAVLEEVGAATRLNAAVDVPQRPGRFRFTHALLQEALVAGLSATARAELHRSAALALEATNRDGVGPLLGEIAHHYFEAAALDTLPQAIDFAARAGRFAMSQLGYDEAAGHFERALQASRSGAVPPTTRLEILVPLGLAQQAAGDDEGSHATLIEAAELARDLGDARTFAVATVMVGGSGAETGTIDWPLIRLLEQALEVTGPADSQRRAFLLSQLSRSLYFVDAERRRAASEESLAIARRLGDKLVLLAALQARQFSLWEPGEGPRRREIGREALEMAHATRQALGVADALAWQILNHLELGELDVVHQALREYRELAAQSRLPRIRWSVTVAEAMLAQLAGRFAAAEQLAQRAAGLLTPSRQNNVAAFFGVQLFLALEEVGRLAELEPTVAIAAERAVNLPIWRAGLAVLHATLGRVDSARQVLAGLGGEHLGELPRDGNLLGTYALFVHACALCGAADLAAPLLECLTPFACDVIILATNVGCLGSAARYVGLAAYLTGQLDLAIGHFEEALAMNERIGAHPQRAHTQHELARALQARGAAGDRQRAAALEAEAAATAARLGMVALQRRLAAGAAGAPVRSAAAPVAASKAQLRGGPRTARLRREGDVWTIACGDELTRLKDTKGVAYLADLLRHPSQEFHALDLGGAVDFRAGDAGEALDADARRAYKHRIAELGDELEEAERLHDVGRLTRLREELDMLDGELARGSGLGGRLRKVGSDAERARLNVTRAVRKVVRKVLVDCPQLGHHLDRAVKTGLFCGYEPDPAFPVEWEI